MTVSPGKAGLNLSVTANSCGGPTDRSTQLPLGMRNKETTGEDQDAEDMAPQPRDWEKGTSCKDNGKGEVDEGSLSTPRSRTP